MDAIDNRATISAVTCSIGRPVRSPHAAGRVYYGPARFDLPVPPHRIAKGSLFIGRTDADGGFSIETIESL